MYMYMWQPDGLSDSEDWVEWNVGNLALECVKGLSVFFFSGGGGRACQQVFCFWIAIAAEMVKESSTSDLYWNFFPQGRCHCALC